MAEQVLAVRAPASRGAALYGGGPLEVFRYDATVSISRQETGSATSFPVENGTTITDHFQNQPTTITLSGVVSDHPLVGFAMPNRTVDARALLDTLKRSATMLTLKTNRDVFTNMLIVDWSEEQTAKSGQSFRPTIRLQQVVIVRAETVPVPLIGALDDNRSGSDVAPEAADGAGGVQDGGRQSTTPVTTPPDPPLVRVLSGLGVNVPPA